MRHDGRGSLGIIWLRGKRTLGHPYILSGGPALRWTYLAQVVRLLPGANRAQVWMVNYESDGGAAFDDVLFVRLRLPVEEPTR